MTKIWHTWDLVWKPHFLQPSLKCYLFIFKISATLFLKLLMFYTIPARKEKSVTLIDVSKMTNT